MIKILLLLILSTTIFAESLFIDRDGFEINGASKAFNNYYEFNLNYEILGKKLDTHFGGEFLIFSYYFFYERDFENENNRFIYTNALALGDYIGIGSTYKRDGFNLDLGEAYFSLLIRNSFLYLGGVYHLNRDIKQSYQLGALFYNKKISPYFHINKYKNDWGFETGVSLINIYGFNLSYNYYKHNNDNKHTLSIGANFSNVLLGNEFGILEKSGKNSITNRISFQIHTKDKDTYLTNSKYFLYFKLDAPLSEIGDGGVIDGTKYNFLNLIVAIKKGIKDENILGFIFNIDSPTLSSSQAEEIVNLLNSSNKKYYVYLKMNSLGDYILASNSNKIVIHPATQLDITGPSFSILFFKKFFDTIGIKAVFFKRAEYKSAPETYTRETPSKESNTQLNQLINNSKIFIEQIISNKRRFSDIKDILNNAPYSPKEAQRVNLVDDINYSDNFIAEILNSNRGNVTIITPNQYFNKDLKDMIYYSKKRVAILSIDGVIARKKPFDFQNPTAIFKNSNKNSILKSIKAIKDDSSIKFVIVRVNSPGGDGLLSDEILHALKQLKKVKPIYVSMGAVAASGGYYVSLASEKIYANNLTITGSIGVYSGKFIFDKLINSLFIKIFIKTFWKNGDIYSPFAQLTQQQEDKLNSLVESFYQLFLDKVKESRKFTDIEVDKVARGRVFSGKDALNYRLIDKIGGISQLLDLYSNNIEDYEIIAYPRDDNFFKRMLSPEKRLTMGISWFIDLISTKYLLLPDFIMLKL